MEKSNLKKQIKRSGLTMRQAADLTGISYETVQRQCSTGVKTITAAVKYAKVLGVPVCKVLGVGDVCNCGK